MQNINRILKIQVGIHLKLEMIPKGDRTVFHKDPRVNSVVDLLLEDETDVYDEIINIINNAYNKDDLSERLPHLVNLYEYQKYGDIFGHYVNSLWAIYSDSRQCRNLRGALLERLIYKLLEKKYISDYKSDISCYIDIDSLKCKMSVDVCFYHATNEVGDSIECKVNPFGLTKDHIENLKDIFTRSNRKISPSVISFSTSTSLRNHVGGLDISIGSIKLFGGENLKNIAKYEL